MEGQSSKEANVVPSNESKDVRSKISSDQLQNIKAQILLQMKSPLMIIDDEKDADQPAYTLAYQRKAQTADARINEQNFDSLEKEVEFIDHYFISDEWDKSRTRDNTILEIVSQYGDLKNAQDRSNEKLFKKQRSLPEP